jgi:hypothetical protein
VFAEHRTAAGRGFRFVLDHVPMLDKDAIFQPKNIDYHPIGGIAIVRVSSMDHHIITFGNGELTFKPRRMLAMNSRT